MERKPEIDTQFVHQLQDGRFFITDQTVAESPELEKILKDMGNYWTRHEGNLDGWVSPRPEPEPTCLDLMRRPSTVERPTKYLPEMWRPSQKET